MKREELAFPIFSGQRGWIWEQLESVLCHAAVQRSVLGEHVTGHPQGRKTLGLRWKGEMKEIVNGLLCCPLNPTNWRAQASPERGVRITLSAGSRRHVYVCMCVSVYVDPRKRAE